MNLRKTAMLCTDNKSGILIATACAVVGLSLDLGATAVFAQGHAGSIQEPQAIESYQGENESSVEELVQALGSPDYEERERATALLKSKDRSFVEKMKHIYVAVQDHEIRVRLSEIAESIIYNRVLAQFGGFLGIRPKNVNQEDEPRLQANQFAVRVERVVSGTVAEKAGLMVGDLIVAFGGEKLNFSYGDQRGFAKLIGSHPPGAEIKFTLLRKDQQVVKRVVLGYRPIRFVLPDDRVKLEEPRREFSTWCAEVAGLSNTNQRE